MSIKQENAEHETHELFQQRWSPRAFDAKKVVDEKDIHTCLEAARWAPSCFGAEPWRFIVCDKNANEKAWQKLLNCLASKNQEWAKHAPVLLMVITRKNFKHNGEDNRWAEYDAGQAAVSFCLQATASGLVTHQMGGFDVDAVRQAFAVPEDFLPMAAIAFGYQGEASQLDEGFQQVEQTPRKRLNLSDIRID